MAIGNQIPAFIELRDALDEIGWTQTEAARRLGVSTNTVYRWCAGKDDVPSPPAMAYIRLYRKVRRHLRKIEEAIG